MHFDHAEYETRLAKVRERMSAARLDALLVTSPENAYYLTGYNAWSFYTHQMVLVAGDKDPVWIGRAMDAPCARHTTWLPNGNIVGYPDDYVDNVDKHPMEFIAAQVARRCSANAVIGVEKDNYYFTAACYEALTSGLPDATFHDAGLLVNWVRIVKSPTELEYMRQAGKLASLSMQSGIDAIEPGVKQSAVAAEIYRAQIRGADEFGGDAPAEPAVMSTSLRLDSPHLTWTDETFVPDIGVNLELGGYRFRYTAALARSVYLGKPPDALCELADITKEGLDAALSSVAPGVTCESVEAAWRGVISRYGEEKASRIGYSVGAAYPPAWIERTASLRPGDRTELRADMTFHLMCGMWRPHIAFVLSETFRVTETGYELLTDLPRKLFIKS